jgi:hypothetical protein
MDYLSDEQIKILIISKDSPHISNIVEQKDFMGKCQDRFIKNSSVFDHFSSFFSTFNSNSDEITSFEKTREIIKSELGFNGVDVLLSHENKSYESIKDDYEMDQHHSEWLNSESNYPEEDVFESNTPEEEKDDEHYY